MKEEKINKLTSSIVSKIKEKRKLQGLSHESMAVELQISPSAYNKIERLETKLTVERLLQIQQILDVSLSEFFDLKTATTYNQEVKDNGIGHQGVENLYYDNKAMAEKFIQNLQEEIIFLKKIIEKK
jgi:transcriptional regulator with XRE-family HTH domain